MITLIWVVAAFLIGILTGEYVSENKIQAHKKVLMANEEYIESLRQLIGAYEKYQRESNNQQTKE